MVELGGDWKSTSGYLPSQVKEGGASAGVTLEKFATNLLTFLTILAGLYFLIMFLIGGLKWISAGGDSSKVDSAKNTLTSAALGLIIVIAAWAIAFIVGKVLGLSILSPAVILDAF